MEKVGKVVILTPFEAVALGGKYNPESPDLTMEEAQAIIDKMFGECGTICIRDDIYLVGEIRDKIFVRHGQGNTLRQALINTVNWRTYHGRFY